MAGCFVYEPAGVRIEHKVALPAGTKAAALFGALLDALRRLKKLVENSQGRPNRDVKKLTGQIEKLCEEWED